MSIRIKASYCSETERGYLMRLFQPLATDGAHMKILPGDPYKRIYFALDRVPEVENPRTIPVFSCDAGKNVL